MKVQKKLIVVAAVLAMVALSLSISYAGRPYYGGTMGYQGEHPGHPCPWGPPALTEEQRSRLTEIKKEFRTETATLRQEVRQKRLELAAILAGPTPDEQQALAKLKELSQAREKLAEKRIQFYIKNREFLAGLPGPKHFFKEGFRHHMGPGYGPGHGRWHGPGMGQGYGGYGRCD